ncbi:MAG: hypothetical protein R3324_10850, partial [Halobacteriales archaeon]|nr:hypothetical protein [Halobacteriales archaeon]
ALIDGEYPGLTRRIEALNYHLVSETWLRETTRVPLTLIDWIESTLGPIGAGVRVGTQAREWEGDLADIDLVTLHPDLVDAVNGVDHATALAAVRAETVAFQTADGGSRAVGHIAVRSDGAADGAIEDLISKLVSLLDRHSQEASIEDNVVVIRERAFDPDAARSLGVPEGPAFGQLSAGDPVEVDGRIVDPDAVHVERTTRVPVLADAESGAQSGPEDPTVG